MKTIKILIGIGIGFLFSASSCKHNKDNKSLNKVAKDLKKIEISIDSAWKRMIASDDKKIENMLILVDRFSYLETYDSAVTKTLKPAILNLKKVRYTPQSMAKSQLIDEYDEKTNEVLKNIRAEIALHPDAEKYQVINQLQNEIQAADDSVLDYRRNYDRIVDKYNALLSKNLENFKKNSGDTSIKLKPLFRLIP